MIEVLAHEIARLARELEILDDQKYKVFCIKEMFQKKRKEGKTIEQCELEVGAHFKIEPCTVHGVIYRKK
jgi:hypothetical protein